MRPHCRRLLPPWAVGKADGHTVPTMIDCLIATFCLREQHSLLHRDRDCDPFEEFLRLAVVHP